MIKLEKELEVLMESPEFVERIMQMESKEEVKKAFESEGVTITDEQLGLLGKMFNEIVEKLSTLKEDELQAIAGGVPECFPNFLKSGTQIARERGKASLVEAGYNTIIAFTQLVPKFVDAVIDKYHQHPSSEQAEPETTSMPSSVQTIVAGTSTESNAKYYAAGAAAVMAAAGVGAYTFRKNIRRWFSK